MVLTKVGVVPPGAGGARLELVDERAARRHRLLRDVRNSVHCVGDVHAVPVDSRRLDERVLQRDPDKLSFPHSDFGPRHAPVVGQRVYRFPGCELPPNLSRFEYNLSRRRTRTAPANGE